jgi:spore coat polysaccharide biosynthesis predicted glycosyltransferase SpsG
VYVQGGRDLGLGHVVRVSTIVRLLKTDGYNVEILFDGDDFGLSQLNAMGLEVSTIEDVMSLKKIDALVLDAVSISQEYLRVMDKCSRRILLSPVFNRPELITEAYLRFPPKGALRSTSSVSRSYSVVREQTDDLVYKESNKLSIGIVMSGGKSSYMSDVVGVVKSANRKHHVFHSLKIAIGAYSFSHIEEYLSAEKSLDLNVYLLQGKNNILKAMLPIDLLIAGDGVIVDEACFSGIPTIVYSDRSCEYKVSDLIVSGSVAFATNPSDLEITLTQLMGSAERREKMRMNALREIDGLGARRLANLITGQQEGAK